MNEKATTSKPEGAAQPNGWLPVVLRNDVVARVIALGEPLCRSTGMELVHVEFQRERNGKVLRIYIDKDGGVSLDDCVGISRELSDLLDVYLDDKDSMGPYRLEVSSPGTDRPIARESDFERFQGHRAGIRILRPMGGQKNFSGMITGCSRSHVSLKTEKETVSIPFEDITRVRLINYHGEI